MRDGAARRPTRRRRAAPGDDRGASSCRMMVGRELGDYYGKRRDRHRRGGPRGRRTAHAETAALNPTTLQRAPRRDPRRRWASRLRQGRARPRTGRRDPEHGSVRVGGRPADVAQPALGARRRDRLRARRPQALRATADTQRGRELLGGLDGQLTAPDHDTRAERRRVREAIERYNVVTPSPREPHHDPLGRQPAEGRARAQCSRAARGARALASRRAASTSARRARSTADAGAAAQGAAIIIISSELPELLGIADRIVVFFRGEVRGEFAAAGMDEEELAHVAVSGAARRRVRLDERTALAAPSARPLHGRPRRAGRRLRLPHDHRGRVPDVGQPHEHREVEQRGLRAGDRRDVRDHLRAASTSRSRRRRPRRG